ncbi:MAG: helix-turn-helix domain-containing protein [Rhodanobacteraceae bacterium]
MTLLESSVGALDLEQLRRSCASCALHELCLPTGIYSDALERLDAVIRDKRLLNRGKPLFRQGDAFHSLFVVRSGSLKTFVENRAGNVQMLGFHLPGEIIGMDALANNRHLCAAEALECTDICELPYARLQHVAHQVPALHRQLMRIMSREIGSDQSHLVMMGTRLAQERLAIFLRSFADRYKRLSWDPLKLLLPMSRLDLANYLGLALETVSRLFSQMDEAGILAVHRKRVQILRPDRLAEMCADDEQASRGDETP